MARRGDGGGVSAGPMNTIIAGFIGLLVIVAIVVLGPVLAGSIQSSVPNLSASSQWNGSFNTNIPSGVAVWTTNVTIGAVVIQKSKSRLRRFWQNGFNFVKSSSSSLWQFTTSGLSHNPDACCQSIDVRPSVAM